MFGFYITFILKQIIENIIYFLNLFMFLIHNWQYVFK